MIVVTGLKSGEELSHSPRWRLTVRTLVNRPMGRFSWTNQYHPEMEKKFESGINTPWIRNTAGINKTTSNSSQVPAGAVAVRFKHFRLNYFSSLQVKKKSKGVGRTLGQELDLVDAGIRCVWQDNLVVKTVLTASKYSVN